MAKQTSEQKHVVERVMHEFKHGDLETKSGDKVTNRDQAIAIGLSEAGISKEKSPAQNKKALQHTRSKTGHKA